MVSRFSRVSAQSASCAETRPSANGSRQMNAGERKARPLSRDGVLSPADLWVLSHGGPGKYVPSDSFHLCPARVTGQPPAVACTAEPIVLYYLPVRCDPQLCLNENRSSL